MLLLLWGVVVVVVLTSETGLLNAGTVFVIPNLYRLLVYIKRVLRDS